MCGANHYCNPAQLLTYFPYVLDILWLHIKLKIHFLSYTMMIIFSFVKIITIHPLTH